VIDVTVAGMARGSWLVIVARGSCRATSHE
jgi:hypothetical protein